MFRVVLSPIIRSAYNCIYSIWYLSHRYCYLPLSWKSWNRFECAVGGVLCSIALSVICIRLFRGKVRPDWFNGLDILQGRWQHLEKVGYSYPSGLEKTLCKWEIYVPLVTKGLITTPICICIYIYIFLYCVCVCVCVCVCMRAHATWGRVNGRYDVRFAAAGS
jgi:hypothetical protein